MWTVCHCLIHKHLCQTLILVHPRIVCDWRCNSVQLGSYRSNSTPTRQIDFDNDTPHRLRINPECIDVISAGDAMVWRNAGFNLCRWRWCGLANAGVACSWRGGGVGAAQRAERPRDPGGVAAFMSAHSKTPCVTPCMEFSSGEGVVWGRRVQQLTFTFGRWGVEMWCAHEVAVVACGPG